jgi:predicted metal-binding protein
VKLELKEFDGWQEQSGATSILLVWVMTGLSGHEVIHFVLCEFKNMDCLYISIESAI